MGALSGMVSDVNAATEVKRLVDGAKDLLLDSMSVVEQRCPRDEYAAYKRAVGRVVSQMLSEIIEPLFERNPSLKPEGWDE